VNGSQDDIRTVTEPTDGAAKYKKIKSINLMLVAYIKKIWNAFQIERHGYSYFGANVIKL
jgi:hypothetical protein